MFLIQFASILASLLNLTPHFERSPMSSLLPIARRLLRVGILSLFATAMTCMLGCEMQPTKIEKDDRVLVNDANYEATVEKSSKPVVMEFHADWCGPCRATEPAVAALSVEMPDVVFAKIDVDEAVELAVKYEVSSIPCFIFFKDGQVVGRSTGSISKSKLESLIAEHLK